MIYFRDYEKSFFIFKAVLLFSLISFFSCREGNPVGSGSILPQIEIGEDNITYIDGEPFFPIGIFSVYIWSYFKLYNRDYDTYDEIFFDISDGGFNTVHTYNPDHYHGGFQEFLDKSVQYGLKLIIPPSTNNDHIPTLVKDVYHDREAPALLSWYLTDEPEQNGISSAEVRQYHDIVKQQDPNHLTSILLGIPNKFADYMNVSDVFMISSYPILENAEYRVTHVSDYVDAAFEAMQAIGVSKPLWVVLQAFGYQDDDNRAWGWDREPTYEEERCMTYLAIVHGAKGIFYYCFGSPGRPGSRSNRYFIPNSPQHWQDLKSITRELEQLTPVLVSPDVAIENLDVNTPVIHFMLKYFQGREYLFAVNSANHEITTTFSGFQNESNELVSDTLSVLFEDRGIAISEGVFYDHFDPYEVHIYSLEY